MRNSGKKTEDIVEAYWDSLGKTVFYHRLSDSSDVTGRNRQSAGSASKLVIADAQPADYIAVSEGSMKFVEVKSSNDKTAFRLTMISTNQLKAARKTIIAGGKYEFIIHKLSEPEQWFKLPADILLADIDDGIKSWKWQLLGLYEVTRMFAGVSEATPAVKTRVPRMLGV